MNHVEKHNSQDDYYSIELAAISQGENKCTSGGNFHHICFSSTSSWQALWSCGRWHNDCCGRRETSTWWRMTALHTHPITASWTESSSSVLQGVHQPPMCKIVCNGPSAGILFKDGATWGGTLARIQIQIKLWSAGSSELWAFSICLLSPWLPC